MRFAVLWALRSLLVLPPAIAEIPEAKEEFLKAMQEDAAHYERLKKVLTEAHYAKLLAQGEEDRIMEATGSTDDKILPVMLPTMDTPA